MTQIITIFFQTWGLVKGGVKEMQVHTGDEKTTKRWEADDRARGRLKIRRVGEDNQNKRHWFMISTSGQIVLSSTRFSGQKGRGVYQ